MNCCTNCILPTQTPHADFDAQGCCRYCREFEAANPSASDPQTQASLRRRLERILDHARGKGDYDCTVGISGGKDSTYLLYLLVVKYGMRVLAVNIDNGFQSERARGNMQRLVRKLKVELVTKRPPEATMSRLYATFLRRAGEFCTPCNMLVGGFWRQVPANLRIPLVVAGNSQRYSSSLEGVSPSRYFDRSYYLSVIRGAIGRQTVEPYIDPPYTRRLWDKLSGHKPAYINLFDYDQPDRQTMFRALVEECDWEPTSEELEHGDCLLNPIKDYIAWRKYGVSEVTGALCALVRNGEMTREAALAEAKTREPRERPAILKPFLERIGMDEVEFEAALQRRFTEFPNLRSRRTFQFARSSFNVLDRARAKA